MYQRSESNLIWCSQAEALPSLGVLRGLLPHKTLKKSDLWNKLISQLNLITHEQQLTLEKSSEWFIRSSCWWGFIFFVATCTWTLSCCLYNGWLLLKQYITYNCRPNTIQLFDWIYGAWEKSTWFTDFNGFTGSMQNPGLISGQEYLWVFVWAFFGKNWV